MSEKRCRTCQEVKPPERFYKSADAKDGRCASCADCHNRRSKEWYKSHPKEKAIKARRHHLRRTYGLEVTDFDQMVKDQGGRCLICGEQPENLNVDHDPITGSVRGLLCWPCNVGIGRLNHDVDRLRAAIRYLETSGQTVSRTESAIA